MSFVRVCLVLEWSVQSCVPSIWVAVLIVNRTCNPLSMGFLDRLTGRRAASPSDSGSQSPAEAAPSGEVIAEAVPAAGASPAVELRDATADFSASSSADGAQRLYNPYEVLRLNIAQHFPKWALCMP